MKSPETVLVCGAFPDRQNSNLSIKHAMTAGFRDCLGEAEVFECSLPAAPAAIRRQRPDLVLLVGSCLQDFNQYRSTRAACDDAGSCLAFWLHDDPYEIDSAFRAKEVADVIFTNDRWSARHYDFPRAYHLPLAADPRTDLRPLDEHRYVDLFFCGVAFGNRIDFVRDLDPFLQRRYQVNIYGDGWPTDLAYCRNERLSHGRFSDLCSVSLATLNIGRHLDFANHRYSLPASTPGPRTFQAAMAGAVQLFLLESLEIFDYFEPGKEILVFDQPKEVIPLLDRLVADPAYAQEIAGAAQRRALAEHTYAHRAQEILRRVASC